LFTQRFDDDLFGICDFVHHQAKLAPICLHDDHVCARGVGGCPVGQLQFAVQIDHRE
jgi:hypothetical protein